MAWIPPQLVIFFCVVILLLIGWIASEFQSSRALRLSMGLLSLGAVLTTAVGFGLVQRLTYNAWYGGATAQLMDTVITEIRSGRSDQLVPRLEELRREFHPTYENRAHYDDAITEFVSNIQSDRNASP